MDFSRKDIRMYVDGVANVNSTIGENLIDDDQSKKSVTIHFIDFPQSY